MDEAVDGLRRWIRINCWEVQPSWLVTDQEAGAEKKVLGVLRTFLSKMQVMKNAGGV